MISHRLDRYLFSLAAVAALLPTAHAAAPLVVEDLGQPVRVRSLGLRCVTRDAAGVQEAWASYETADRFALLGVRLDNGKLTWVDTTRFGQRHVQMITAADGNLYAFAGVPGRFLKYDVTRRELIDLGVPAKEASYWLGA